MAYGNSWYPLSYGVDEKTRTTELVRANLDIVLASPLFAKAPRQSAFLRFIVENTLDGNADALKEYQIGLLVYERGPSYETRNDPIVRVEAARLRSKLREYYDTIGMQDPVRIELPKGAYVPVFTLTESAAPAISAPAAEAGSRRRFLRDAKPWFFIGAVALLAGVAALSIAVYNNRRPAEEGMPRSLAILPFRDLSRDGGMSQLSETLAEALSDELSRVDGLLVAGQTSTLRLRDKIPDPQELGRELQVGAVLEGSIQSSGQQVRIRARLLDVASGFQLWSGTFDRTIVDVFAVEDEIAGAIASTLRVQLSHRREDPSAVTSPERLAAQDIFAKARRLHRRGDPSLLLEARSLHLKAVQTDPAYPLGHSGLAHIDITIMSEGLRPISELRAEAISSIDRALALDPGLSDAFSARIRLARDIDADFRMVENTCLDATRMFPSAASIRANCGTAYSFMGRFSAAEEELRAAVRLDPLWPGGLDGLAWAKYLAGRYEEALRQVEELTRVDPQFLGARRTYARILAGSGRYEQARSYLEAQLKITPLSRDLLAQLGYVLGKLDDRRGALNCLASLGPNPLESEQALIWAGIGDISRAAAHLERALDRRETAALEILADRSIPLGSHTQRLRAKVKL